MSQIYLANGIISAIALAMATSGRPLWISGGWIAYIAFHLILWQRLKLYSGSQLNQILKFTSLLIFFVAIYLLIIIIITDNYQ